MSKKPKQAELPALAQLPVFEYKGQLVADSRDVAPFVEKEHRNLLRDIRQYIAVMNESLSSKLSSMDYFIPATYKDSIGRQLPCFYCTEKGCSMVANKAPGDKGIIFTALFTNAFFEMRRLLQERQSIQWQQVRVEGKATRRSETDAVKAFVEYAAASGSKHPEHYYTNFTKLANKAVGIEAGQRDQLSTAQLLNLRMTEQVIDRTIWAELAAGTEYHEIYCRVKAAVQQFTELALAPKPALPRPAVPPGAPSLAAAP